MSVQDNKKVVKDLFDAISKGDVAAISALTTEDVTWWVVPNNKFSGLHSKSAWLEIIPQLFAGAAGPLTFRIDEVTAEDDRVSMTAKGHLLLRSGKVYESDYHFLLWVRDGKVSACKEYADSVHIGQIFGFPEELAVA